MKQRTERKRNGHEQASQGEQAVLQRKVHELSLKARTFLADLPAQVDEQVERYPYRTLAVTFALGAGVGILAASRVTRFLVTSLAVYAASELAKESLHKALAEHNLLERA